MRHHRPLGMNHKQCFVLIDKKSIITILISVELGTRTYLLVSCRVWNRSWTTNAMRMCLAIIDNNNRFLNLEPYLQLAWFAVSHMLRAILELLCLQLRHLKNNCVPDIEPSSFVWQTKGTKSSAFSCKGRTRVLFFKSVAHFRQCDITDTHPGWITLFMA